MFRLRACHLQLSIIKTMKYLLTLLLGIMTIGTVYAAPFTSFQLATSTLTNGNVLQTNGQSNKWVATSSLGFPSISGFMTFVYASSTFPSFTYASSSYLTASSTTATITTFYSTNAWITNASTTNLSATGAFLTSLFSTNASTTNISGTRLDFTNATTTNLSGSGITFTNAVFTNSTTTLASFARSTSTNAFITNASTTNLSSSGFFSTNAFMSNASTTAFSATGVTIGNGLFTGTLDVTGKTTLGNASTTNISASTGAFIQDLFVAATQTVIGKSTLANATTTQVSASTGIFTPNAWITTLTGTNASSTNATSTNFFLNGGTSGSVLFLGTGGLFTQNNAQFFWDNGANFLGIGSSTPRTALVVTGTAIIPEYNWGTGTSTNMTVRFGTSTTQTMQMGSAAISLTLLPNTGVGGGIKLRVLNPTTTAGALTFYSSTTIRWCGITAPTQTTATNRGDIYTFVYGTGTSSALLIDGCATAF